MGPSCFGTYTPRSVSQPQLQEDSLHRHIDRYPTAQAFPKRRAEVEEELLALKRIDLTIAPYFHRFPPYSGQWEQRRFSNPHPTENLFEPPQDVTAYTSWVLEGAMSFICDFDHDLKQMADLIADIRVGIINPAVPNIPMPLFSKPSRTMNSGTNFAEWITRKYTGQAETVPSGLKSYHFLEERIRDCQIRRDALWMLTPFRPLNLNCADAVRLKAIPADNRGENYDTATSSSSWLFFSSLDK